jgi:hypothetical protein
MARADLPNFAEPLINDEAVIYGSWARFMHQLFKRIGGGKSYNLGGLLTANTTAVGNVGSGADNLITYSLEKNILLNAGDAISIKAYGTFADNSNNKTLKLIIGTTTLFSTGAVAFQDQDWMLESEIIRTGAATQKCITTLYTDYADITNIVDYVAGTEDFTTALTIKCTGEATTTNDIVQQGLTVKIFPAG